jgi:hypothetical protein
MFCTTILKEGRLFFGFFLRKGEVLAFVGLIPQSVGTPGRALGQLSEFAPEILFKG